MHRSPLRVGQPAKRLRNGDNCWCGSGHKLKRCHGDHRSVKRTPVAAGVVAPRLLVPRDIVAPSYVVEGRIPSAGLQIFTDPAEVAAMRAACRVAAEVLAETAAAVAPGVTTDELDRIAHEGYLRRGAYPSTLGYGSYMKSICTSVNEVICHGIPDSRPLQLGDIVNIDVTAYLGGFHGDCSATFAVGGDAALDEPTRALVRTTEEALHRGIAEVAPGRTVRVIGAAIETFAHRRGYGVVADYGGHGIGRVFHAPPHIHHTDDPSSTTTMVPGMVFTIEPMLTAGAPNHRVWADDWTVVTTDRLPSAQFEHTVMVTDDGVEILTVAS